MKAMQQGRSRRAKVRGARPARRSPGRIDKGEVFRPDDAEVVEDVAQDKV